MQMFKALAPLLREIEICIQWVFCRKFNFGQLLFKVFFDIIKSFGRNQVKFSKNYENRYFCSKNPYFRKNPYTDPYALEKSVYVRIHSYVWQHWPIENSIFSISVLTLAQSPWRLVLLQYQPSAILIAKLQLEQRTPGPTTGRHTGFSPAN